MGGAYKPYPEYKDSGVEWLGDVPAHWKVCRVKNVATINPSKSEVRALPACSQVSFIPMEAVGEKGELDASRVKALSEVLTGYTYVADGDIMIAKITPCFENGKGAIAKNLTNGIGFATTEVIPIRPQRSVDADFLFYVLSCNPFKVVAESSMYGAGGQKRVADSFVAEYHLSFPSESERVQIANFLDHEAAKIDTLIKRQQQLIQLLKEKRQAVINHAMTKGFNSNAKMRDSGVEWLGEIPEDWGISRLKYHTKLFEQGWSPQCDSRQAEGDEYGVLKVGCVNYGAFNSNENKALPKDLKPQLQYLIRQGDLLISRANTKELVGSAAVVDGEYNNIMLCDKLYRLRFNELIDPQWVAYYLALPIVRRQIELGASGASHSMQNIGQSTIKELPVVIPSPEEMSIILSEVKNKISIFELTLNRANEQISLLQERRTALISAAVTGKIDIRNWIAPKKIKTNKEVAA